MYCPDPAPIANSYLFYILVASVPMFFYKGFISIAGALSLFVYLLMYIPMIYVTYLIDMDSKMLCQLILFTFIIACFCTDNRYIYISKESDKLKKIPFRFLEILTFLLIIFVLFAEGRSLSFVNILSQSDVMYENREAYSESRLVIVGYLISWIRSAFLPVLLVYYLKTKNKYRYILSLFGYLIIFMLDMQKITFLMPYIISLCYLLTQKQYFEKRFHVYIIGFFSVVSIALISTLDNILSYGIAAIFIMRTQCLESWLFPLYVSFFKYNPYTYYSHINIVNAITNYYPYKEPLGIAVAEDRMNANASFLITDGYAAAGIYGMFFIGLVFIIFKSIFNSVGLKYQRKYLVLTLFSAISSMLNVSLFTAIFSSGFLMLYIIYRYVDLKALEK
jgi:hypothetical protein